MPFKAWEEVSRRTMQIPKPSQTCALTGAYRQKINKSLFVLSTSC
ncbi:hypothetical protein ARMA_1943 [Ardenticatena maritima]|uniref:Uncharacterized protein n=1 Tax=Ardenticatena maritima TaxID=872965 RepID=A0A0M9UD33_9CHLR|nr:hypothetical protein ARMA_1943 [Ardenticatena maritima]